MAWNHDLTTAPQDAPIWLATACGKVIKSYWVAPVKKEAGRWAGVGAPIAWQPFIVPEHPGFISPAADIDPASVHFMTACDSVGGL